MVVFEPPRVLELAWTGPALVGRNRYELTALPEETELAHKKWLTTPGLLRLMEPFMRKPFFQRLEARLEEIKRGLETEQQSQAPQASATTS